MATTNLFKFGFFLLLFGLNNSLQAQLKRTFAKGVITLKSGEVLTGLIQEEELSKMAYSVKFKNKEEENFIKVFDTTQIKSISLQDGEMFELLKLKGHYMTSELSIIGKLLVKGKASLYKIVYEGDDVYIITKEEKSFVLHDDEMPMGTISNEVTPYFYKLYLNNALLGSTISQRLENISFNEKTFVDVIKEFNTSFGSQNQVFIIKKKPVHYVLIGAGGMKKNSKENEIYVQGVYRTFFPKISRSISVNVGFNYFKYKFLDAQNYYTPQTITNTLLSVPFQVQQNILNKAVRPYVFIGFDLSYLKTKDARGASLINTGLQRNFGIGILYGLGIEADIYKGLMIKTEFRNEIFSHLIMAGIGYHFLLQ